MIEIITAGKPTNKSHHFQMPHPKLICTSEVQPSSIGMSPHAAHEFLRSTGKIIDDNLLSGIVASAGKLTELDIDALLRLHLPGPRSAAQLYSILASRLHFDGMRSCASLVCSGATNGDLRALDLANMAVRRLLLEKDLFGQAQQIQIQQQFPHNLRERLPMGQGIWLGVNAKIIHLKYVLQDLLDYSKSSQENIGLVLVSNDSTANLEILSIAKRFPTSVYLSYSDEVELVKGLRELNMKVFVEMHGLQNPDTFVEKLQTGVANVQLSWAGLSEGCALPFIDGQLLDPVLAKSKDVVRPAIALSCWLPPTHHFPRITRGDTLGLWASPQKLSESFFNFCSDLAARAGRKLQILCGVKVTQLRALPPHIEVIADAAHFRPAVLLDPSPMSGGNACLFALLCGIPVVSMPGQTVSSRLGASVLLHYGFHEGLVSNLLEYEERVLMLCKLPNVSTIRQPSDWKFTETIEGFLTSNKPH